MKHIRNVEQIFSTEMHNVKINANYFHGDQNFNYKVSILIPNIQYNIDPEIKDFFIIFIKILQNDLNVLASLNQYIIVQRDEYFYDIYFDNRESCDLLYSSLPDFFLKAKLTHDI